MNRCRSLVATLLLAISMSSFTVGTVAVAQLPDPITIGIHLFATTCLGNNYFQDNLAPKVCGGACYLGGGCDGLPSTDQAKKVTVECVCL